MNEKRQKSDPTVPILATRMKPTLDAEGATVHPDDEVPTSPDFRPGACKSCKGSTAYLVETATGYRGPVKCARCKATGIDPGTPWNPEKPHD
jgi:hypothetical protein